MPFNDVGVVVIGRNEGPRLLRCLGSLPTDLQARVYVDSASTDGSPEAAEDSGAIVVRLDLAVPFTAARARNAGVHALLQRRTDLRFIQFVDGDCELEPNWIELAREFLSSRADVAAACGRRKERFPDRSVYNGLCDVEWNTPVGECEACGGDALYRVSAFAGAGGFNADLIAGEEPELGRRLRQSGWRIWRLDLPMTIHDADMHRLRQWWQRGARSGLGYLQSWLLTRAERRPAYRRELGRAVVWGGILPSIALVGAILSTAIPVIILFIYLVQAFRIAFKAATPRDLRWRYVGLTFVSKFAELWGAMKLAATLARRKAPGNIHYK